MSTLPVTAPTVTVERQAGASAVRRWVAEVAAGVGVVLAALIVLGQFAGDAFGSLLLFNGDSQLLPMMAQSITRDQHFDWVFSSPLFFFTEFPVYLVFHVLAPSVQWAVTLNALANVLIVYVLVRWLAKRLQLGARAGIAVALTVTFLCVGCMLLEQTTEPRQTAMASFMLFGTYYVGVLHIGLALLALLAPLRSLDSRRARIELVVAGVLVAIGGASDPLLLLQVVGPLLVTIVILLSRRLIARRLAAWEIGVLVGGAAVALLARATVLARFVGVDVGGYLKGGDLEVRLRLLGELVTDMFADGRQRIELLAVLAMMIAGVVIALRASAGSAPGRAFLAWFAAMAGPVVLGMVVVAGNVEARYLQPMTLFPFLALVAVTPPSAGGRARRVVTALVATSLVAVGVAAVPSAERVQSMTQERPPGIDCLERAAAEHDATAGVSYYWRARALDVYGGPRVMSVMGTFVAYKWLNNVGAYRSHDFSFVVVDGPGMGDVVRGTLGRPTSATECGWFQVWFYAPGSTGFERMNTAIDDSLD